MTITRKIVLEANDDMIDNILEELHNECDYWARDLLDNAGLGDYLDWDEYKEYKDKLAEEIFDDVIARLNFENKAE